MRLTPLCLVASAMSLMLGVARADPMPAGSCSPLDDGVASMPRAGPASISMGVPIDKADSFQAPFQTAIVDLSFVVDANGTVYAAEILCASPPNPAFTAALLKAASNWRFVPARNSAKVAYRVIVPRASSESITVQLVFLGSRPLA